MCRYLHKRERVLGAYMVCLAFHAVYLRNRIALQLGPQSALAALVWFSRVQAAEPLLFHAVMFAVSGFTTVSCPVHWKLPDR